MLERVPDSNSSVFVVFVFVVVVVVVVVVVFFFFFCFFIFFSAGCFYGRQADLRLLSTCRSLVPNIRKEDEMLVHQHNQNGKITSLSLDQELIIIYHTLFTSFIQYYSRLPNISRVCQSFGAKYFLFQNCRPEMDCLLSQYQNCKQLDKGFRGDCCNRRRRSEIQPF